MHPEAFDYVRRIVAGLGARRRVVEIGSKAINGTIRPLFHLADDYIGVDIAPGPGVDVVANGATYEPPFAPDTVISCEVLEHSAEAEAICRNAHRMLGPGGVFIVTAAGEGRAPHSAVDGGALRDGEYYRNVSAAELAGWLSDFAHVEIETRGPDIYAVAWKGEA